MFEPELLAALQHSHTHGERAVLMTVVAVAGSTPRNPGARMLVREAGPHVGTIGGGRIEHEATQRARQMLTSTHAQGPAQAAPELVEYQLTHELGMCCGGKMSVFLEPIHAPETLIVFGCGHVGQAVVRAAAPLGFVIHAVDDLPENLSSISAEHTLASYEPSDILAALPLHARTYAVIATREHALDQRLLEILLPHPLKYIGVIGSERKARMQQDRLATRGFTPADIARVTCPIGLPLGGETPSEIGICIVAQLLQVRHATRL